MPAAQDHKFFLFAPSCLVQVLPNAALSYYAYEAFKRLLAAED